MSTGLSVLFAAAVWWVGTGLVVWVVRRKAPVWPALTVGFSALALSLVAIELSKMEATSQGAFVGFFAAIVVWGVLEMAHLLGWLTGPVKDACPEHLQGWPRFVRAAGVGLYHDLAIVAVGVSLWVLLWQQANNVAVLTFCTLAFMRWSAKLNLYLGVANFDSQMVPQHMHYMASYMRRRAFNPLFPLSVLFGCIAVWVLLANALGGTESYSFSRTSGLLVATMAALGVLEHVFLMLPLKDSRLWHWALTAGARS